MNDKSTQKWIVPATDGAEHLEGCACQYIKERSRERLQAWIAAHGGGAPDTDANFANAVLIINRILEQFLDARPPLPKEKRKAGSVLER